MDGAQVAIAAGGVVISGLVSYFTALIKTRVDVAQISTKLDAFVDEMRRSEAVRRDDYTYIRDRLDRALNGKHP